MHTSSYRKYVYLRNNKYTCGTYVEQTLFSECTRQKKRNVGQNRFSLNLAKSTEFWWSCCAMKDADSMDEEVYSGHIAETKKSSASVGVNSRKVNKSKGIVFLSPLPRCNPHPSPAITPGTSDRWLSFGWWNTIFLRENFRIADGGDYVGVQKFHGWSAKSLRTRYCRYPFFFASLLSLLWTLK